ncbi:MAG: response regulator [Planctomycetota bacterium]
MLLVDESRGIHRRVSRILAGAGHTVVGCAEGAPEAIKAIGKERPDVVLVDINLAEGSGFDLLRAGQRWQEGPATVIFSNSATVQHRRRARELGVDSFLDKSHEWERLLPVINSIQEARE